MFNGRHTVALALTLAAGSAALAGPLTPPAGPIASTFKTLGEVEARTAINATNTPGSAGSVYQITQPGSYYLTGNLVGEAGKYTITVSAAGVTIDLNGFTISGGFSALNGGFPNGKVVVKNGTVRDTTGTGMNFTGFSVRPVIEDVAFINTGDLALNCSSNAVVRRCTVMGTSSGNGINVQADSLVEQCQVSGAAGFGILAYQGSRVIDCTCSGCTLSGFYLAYKGVIATGCVADGNTNSGFELLDAAADNCTAMNNSQRGFDLTDHCTLTHSTVRSNKTQGIHAHDRCTIVGNQVRNNNTAGLSWAGIFVDGTACRVEENECTENGYGLYISGGTNNIVVKNISGSNPAGNYFVAAGNSAAPIVTNPGSNTFSTMTPWSNIVP